MTNKKPIKTEPYGHQKEAFNFAMKLYDDTKNSRGVAMLVEMGCGKTLTAISVAGELHNSGGNQKTADCMPVIHYLCLERRIFKVC